MSQSQGLAPCPICLSSMSSEGDHKMCALKCGHIFGFICIFQCLENKNECPICRQKATIDDVIPLILNYEMPSENIISQLNKEKDQLLLKQQQLAEELKTTKEELNSTKDELAQALQFSSEYSNQNSFNKNKNNSTYSNPIASVIYERKVTDAFRLSVSNNQLFVSQKTGSKFGLQISSLNNFNNSYFLTMHDGQIRDISSSPDFSTIATASIDKSLCLVNNQTAQIISRFSVSEPLWSCCWSSRFVLAAGGNCGKLFIRDIRTGTINSVLTNNENSNSDNQTNIIFNDQSVFQMAPGPPLFSVLPISSTRILCVSPIIGRYFDLRNAKFEPNSNNIQGGQLVCCIPNYTSVSSLSQSQSQSSPNHSYDTISQNKVSMVLVTTRIQPQSAKSVYYSIKSDGLLQAVRSHDNKYFSTISRQSMIQCGGVIYTICPDEATNDFSIFPSNRIDEDIWARWRSNFPASAHPSPVLDVFATKYSSSQLMLFSLSSSLLRINLLKI